MDHSYVTKAANLDFVAGENNGSDLAMIMSLKLARIVRKLKYGKFLFPMILRVLWGLGKRYFIKILKKLLIVDAFLGEIKLWHKAMNNTYYTKMKSYQLLESRRSSRWQNAKDI